MPEPFCIDVASAAMLLTVRDDHRLVGQAQLRQHGRATDRVVRHGRGASQQISEQTGLDSLEMARTVAARLLQDAGVAHLEIYTEADGRRGELLRR